MGSRREFCVLLCLLSCPYLIPWFFHFQFSPTRCEWLLTKINSQHRQNGTLQMVKMQTSAYCRQWVEIRQLMQKCAGQGRVGRNNKGVGRKSHKHSQSTHTSLQVYSSHCHCLSFSLLLSICTSMNKRSIALLMSMSLEKKPNNQKPNTSDQVTF